MSLRKSINKNQAVSGVVAVVVLAIAASIYLWVNRTPPPPVAPTQQWFCDLGDGKLFTVSMSEVPPIDAPSGKTAPDGSPGGVQAHVFSCTSCADEKSRFVGYLQTYTSEARSGRLGMNRPAGGGPQGAAMAALRSGVSVAGPEGTKWVGMTEKNANEITRLADAKCGGKEVECFPPNPPPK